MLSILLYGLFILACLVMIVAVLLQPGKADAGALFTSSVSSTAFGPRGTQTLLAKITIAAAATFMLVALLLSLPFASGSRSVVESEAETTTAPVTAPPAASPAQENNPAPAATAQTQGSEVTPPVNSNTNAANGNANTNPDGAPAASPQQN
ncbi:MAG: preprotein translocase subunit SecG [Pyrinomonadaceae bacterium]